MLASTLPDISESAANDGTVMTSKDSTGAADNRQYDFIYGTPGLPDAQGKTTNPTPVRKASSGGTVDLDGTTSTGVHSVDLNMVSPTVGGCGNKGLSLSPAVIYKYPITPDIPDTLKATPTGIKSTWSSHL